MDSEDIITTVIVLAVIAFIGWIGSGLGSIAERADWQKQAVERGYATWVIVDATGKTEFQWNDEAKEVEQ